jgi:hypothetical protein
MKAAMYSKSSRCFLVGRTVSATVCFSFMLILCHKFRTIDKNSFGHLIINFRMNGLMYTTANMSLT